MSRVCDITSKSVRSGHNVSHSNIKSKRRFLPNLHNLSLRSEILGKDIPLRLSVQGIRTIEHNCGLDNYLLTTRSSKLSPTGLKIKKLIKKELAKRQSV
jgi:large subunit ribosomal protein L28